MSIKYTAFTFLQKLKLLLGVCNFVFVKTRVPRGNRMICGSAMLRGLKIRIRGKSNEISIDPSAVLIKSKIIILGSNNKITVGKDCHLNGVTFYIEDSGGAISVGSGTTVQGSTRLAAMEGTSIYIGEDCMFSSDIAMRTGDSHSIVDGEGNRLNKSVDIRLGNHVWVGAGVTCLKNVEIADNCIVGATSTLNKKYLTPGCIIAGVPAKQVKTDVNWLRRKI